VLFLVHFYSFFKLEGKIKENKRKKVEIVKEKDTREKKKGYSRR